MTLSLKRSFLRLLPILIFVLAALLTTVLLYRSQRRPVITQLDRVSAATGDKLEILGEHFGPDRDGARLFIGATPLTSTGILEWDPTRIVARVPRNDGAVLVRIQTRAGLSEGMVLGDASRFPRVDYGPWLSGAPYVEYADPPGGAPGALITLRGRGFGDKAMGGEIWVNQKDELGLFGTSAPDFSLYIQASIESWSSEAITFRVPWNASSGNIYVVKSGMHSNPVSFDRQDGPGQVQRGDGVRWSLSQSLRIDRIGSFPGSSLYIHLPQSVPGMGQNPPLLLERSGGENVKSLRDDDGSSLYRLDNPQPEDLPFLQRQIVVETFPVRVQVAPSQLKPYDPSQPDLAKALGVDDWIRPDLVPRTTGRVIGSLRDDWSKARAIYDYVIDRLDWSDDPPSRSIPDYIGTRLADSEGYSFLFVSMARAAQIPARVVGGITIGLDQQTQRWWWAEIWIEGIGWVPVDPAMGDGFGQKVTNTIGLGFDYFGGLEGRHIAFSRGILPTTRLQTESTLFIPEDRYSLQGSWEEVSGNLDSYTSHWEVPRVLSSYAIPAPR